MGCTIKASPPVSNMVWQKYSNGHYTDIQLYNGSKFKVASWNAPSLMLTDSKTSDSGTYRCSATNHVGTSYSEDVSVSITGGMSN